jgi:hypothetical protein
MYRVTITVLTRFIVKGMRAWILTVIAVHYKGEYGMPVRFKIFFYLVLISFFLYAFSETDRKLRYDVIRNGKVIGYLDAIRKDQGGTVEYSMESNVKVSMLLDFSLYSKVLGSFSNGFLTYGSIIRRVNGHDKANARITWHNDRYLIQDKDESIELKEKITYTTACLMHDEPINRLRIFSENFKRFIPIKAIKPHQYELQLPDGNRNYYTYSNGICVSAEVNTTLTTAYFRLKN